MNKYLQGIILILIAAGVVFLLSRNHGVPKVEIKDFQSCQMAGGSIVDGDPVKCVAPNGQTFDEQETGQPEVVVDTPAYGALVTSPMTVSGKVRGSWMFEGNLPMMLKDSNGKVLYQKGYQVPEGTDWMTTDYVPFATTIIFPTPETDYGVFIISKDNPSGLSQFDSAFAVPVKFR